MKSKRLGLLLLASALLFFTPIFAQSIVTGKVTDSTGSALPGVTVQVGNSQRAVRTNPDGSYSITVPSDKVLLQFASVGYESYQTDVNGRSSIDVQLKAVHLNLDEVVVVGYGTQKKKDLTGSVSSVNSKTLKDRNISSFEQGLQGQAAGVHVIQSGGQPGGRTLVRIRGQNSIMGGSDPLYVIDGIPVTSSNDGNTSLLSAINPADIETFDILKDASAIAIYGARGSNGVIIITTKRGKKGQQAFNVKSSLGVADVTKKIALLNSRQFVELANERAVNDGVPKPFPNVETASAINTDWQDEIFRTAYTPEIDLSLSGGNEKTKYFTSANYFNQEGTIINSKFTRGSFRLNLDQQVNDRFSFSGQLTASRSSANRSDAEAILSSALGMPPINSPYDAQGNYTKGDVLLGYPFSDSRGDNPLITANERINRLTTFKFLGNLRSRYILWKDMTVELMVGTDQTNIAQDQYSSRLIRGNPDGSGAERRTETTYYIVENLYQYNKSFGGGRHALNATAGFTWETQSAKYLSSSSAGFITDEFENRNLGAGARFNAPDNGRTEWNLVSFLGRVNYNFSDRYLITVTGRRDGSSRFGEGNKWGFFPSAAFAWKVKNEDFLKDVSRLSDLKLRLSWGSSGNQAIDPYQSLQRYQPQSLVLGNSAAIGFAPDNLGNPNLKWETTDQLNAGVDVGLINNRFTISLDFYQKKTKDLLAVVNLPPNSGFATTLQNIGAIENRGIELTLGTSIINRQNFSWNVNLNGAVNKNKVTALSRGADIVAPNISFVGAAHVLRVGEPVSAFYGYREEGLTANGLIKYADIDKNGVVNALDRVILGKPYPDFTFGLNSTLRYRAFNLSFFIQGEQGKSLLNANNYYSATSFFRGVNNIDDVVNRWTPANPDVNAPYPKASASLNVQWSDRFIEDASYIRLRNLQLDYNVPMKSRGIKSARLFVSAQNLVTLTDYSWYDPDVNTFDSGDLRLGVDMGSYPVARTVTFGLALGL